MNLRRTLAEPVRFEGLGLHFGEPVTVTVHPAEDGIHFRSPAGRWRAVAENVTDTTRCTRLGEVSTIEHLMSALAGLEVTEAEVELTAGELPAMDGSALPYVREFQRVGTVTVGEWEPPALFKRVFLQEESLKIAIGRGDGHWRYSYHAGDRWPGEQSYESLDIVSAYAEEVAPARTFAMAEEIPAILQMGLAKGLDAEKALIIGLDGYKNDALFEDEPARHKLLDLIGDLYLSGIPIRNLNVAAERSGHRSNVQAAKLLREHLRLAETTG